MKVSAVLAAIPVASMAMELPNMAIEATSKAGSRLLSKARRLENGNDNVDLTWVSGYSLKFDSCVASQDYYGGYFANNGENQDANQGYYYNDAQREGYQGMYTQQLVHFKLCPSNSCTFCKNGADYVVDLSDFVDAVLEAKMTALQYKCEKVRENCYCENAQYKESCYAGCLQNAGMAEGDCVEEGQNQNGYFNLQEAVECMKIDVDKEAIQQYYYSTAYYGQAQQDGQQDGMDKLYVGPYCAANGRSIFLGAFIDETCSYSAPKGLYEAIHYGNSLPYAKKSLVDSGCVSCKEPTEVENQNYWDAQDADSVTQVCSNLYSTAAKCEENLKGYFMYRNNFGCDYIKSLKSASVIPGANIGAKAAAGIFGVTTIMLAALAAVLMKRSRRQNVSLTGNDVLA